MGEYFHECGCGECEGCLRAICTRLDAERDSLRAENERLRGALESIANHPGRFDASASDQRDMGDYFAACYAGKAQAHRTCADIAKAALGEGE